MHISSGVSALDVLKTRWPLTGAGPRDYLEGLVSGGGLVHDCLGTCQRTQRVNVPLEKEDGPGDVGKVGHDVGHRIKKQQGRSTDNTFLYIHERRICTRSKSCNSDLVL